MQETVIWISCATLQYLFGLPKHRRLYMIVLQQKSVLKVPPVPVLVNRVGVKVLLSSTVCEILSYKWGSIKD